MRKLITLLLLIFIVTGCSDKPINDKEKVKYIAKVEFPVGTVTEYKVRGFKIGSDRFIYLYLEDGTTLRVSEDNVILQDVKGE